MYALVTIGPTQPSRQRRPLAASISTTVDAPAALAGSVPSMNSSSTVRRVEPLGLRPVNASTLRVTRPFGFTRLKRSIGMPLATSDRSADHNGAEVSSDSLPSLGELLELPIQMPATSAGSFLSFGGAM